MEYSQNIHSLKEIQNSTMRRERKSIISEIIQEGDFVKDKIPQVRRQ
jgi:hypothetical protein